MKKLLLLIFATLFLMATELPKSIETTIQTFDNQGNIQLGNTVPKGMSGIIIHNYGNGLSAITHSTISQGQQMATFKSYDVLRHENLPNIKTAPKKADKVIFGNLYNNILLIAPNQQSYAKITNSIKRSWVHPDIYAMYLIRKEKTSLSLKNLKSFAQDNQVGLIAIADRNSLKILDPISGEYIANQPLNISVAQAQSPFYARFEQIENNLFGANGTTTFAEYYRGIGKLK